MQEVCHKSKYLIKGDFTNQEGNHRTYRFPHCRRTLKSGRKIVDVTK
jgi:hypothetical protein